MERFPSFLTLLVSRSVTFDECQNMRARHALAPSYSNLVGVANPPRSASCRRRRRLVTSIDFNIIWKSPSSDINNHPFIVQLSDTVSV